MTNSVNLSVADKTKQAILNNGVLSGYRNKIINGNFLYWQRGTSGTASAYIADRWQSSNSGTTKTCSQQSFTVGQTQVPGNPKYFMRHVVSSSAGSTNYCAAIQKIEDVTLLSGKTITLTFWAKADTSRNIAIEFNQVFGTGGSPSSTINGIGVNTCSLTTSWQKFSFTVSIPSVSGYTLGTSSNDFLQLNFWFDSGSSFASRTNSLGQQSGTFDLARVSLVEGDATGETDPFYPLHPQQELALCQRYYETGQGWMTGYHIAANSMGYNISYAVPKRTASVTITPSWSYANANGGTISAINGVGFFAYANITASGGGTWQLSWTADAEL